VARAQKRLWKWWSPIAIKKRPKSY